MNLKNVNMDVGLYRDDEQFSFDSSSPYTDTYSSDMSNYESFGQSEFFERIHYMPGPPNHLFEWEDSGRRVNDDLRHSHRVVYDAPQTNIIFEGQNDIILPEEAQDLSVPWPAATQGANTEQDPNIKLQDILELPEIVNNLEDIQPSSSIIKTEPIYDNRISHMHDSSIVETDTRRRTVSETEDLLNISFSSTEMTNFDIAEYIFEENKQSIQSIPQIDCTNSVKNEVPEPVVAQKITKRSVGAGRKKIDMKAQRYVVENRYIKKSLSDDECDVDIETVSEEENEPVLEAGDLASLLEKFEAAESDKCNEKKKRVDVVVNLELKASIKPVKTKIEQGVIKQECIVKKEECVEYKHNKKTKKEPASRKIVVKQEKTDRKEETLIKNVKTEPEHTKPVSVKTEPEHKTLPNTQQNTTKQPKPATSTTTANKSQIRESLPQDLIDRIKESGKRKPITVIQPIANRKVKPVKPVGPPKLVPIQMSKTDMVKLDHNYCSTKSSSNVPVVIKKDSGFVSSEDDDKTIISRQPTVKNADGTLMVSLLKANTIRKIECKTEPTAVANNKRKLNLEEYKKRRKDFLTPQNSSLNSSPNTSTCSSPLPEDEHQKMLKHQEKLRKMAEELLNSAPKSEKKSDLSSIYSSSAASSASASPCFSNVKPELSQVKTEQPPVKIDVPVAVEFPKVPSYLERVTVVSVGVNTDFNGPLEPVVKLQEIKPLLEKASDKISDNSLISSVIENIPKVIDKKGRVLNVQGAVNKEDAECHGEDMRVMYLEKNRVRVPTSEACTQTNITFVEQCKKEMSRRSRKRSTSSSSSSNSSVYSNSSKRFRHDSISSSSSNCSRSSRRSTCSSRSSRSSNYYSHRSYSRSRSRSPRYRRTRSPKTAERDHLNAVEERRIIYVGRITKGTIKDDLRKKFYKFGPITKISLHFRDIGENYGFVTFKYKEDAHAAYEHGNEDPSYPYYKISFGGRREFCKAAYSDLDNMRDESFYHMQSSDNSYDKLLKDTLEKLKKRKV